MPAPMDALADFVQITCTSSLGGASIVSGAVIKSGAGRDGVENDRIMSQVVGCFGRAEATGQNEC